MRQILQIQIFRRRIQKRFLVKQVFHKIIDVTEEDVILKTTTIKNKVNSGLQEVHAQDPINNIIILQKNHHTHLINDAFKTIRLPMMQKMCIIEAVNSELKKFLLQSLVPKNDIL